MTYRDMAMGGAIRQVPVGSFVDLKYGNTYGGIKRKDEKRIISVSSNVLNGFNPNEVVAEIQNEINQFNAPAGVNIKMGGEQEEQAGNRRFSGYGHADLDGADLSDSDHPVQFIQPHRHHHE